MRKFWKSPQLRSWIRRLALKFRELAKAFAKLDPKAI